MQTATQSGKYGADTKPAYYPVSFGHLAVVSVLTFGLYQIYWFYKNWVFIRDRDQSNISPWARALLSPFYCWTFAEDLETNSHSDDKRVVPIWALVLYTVFLLCGLLPFLLGYLPFLAFIFLRPAVQHINNLNVDTSVKRNSAFSLRKAMVLLVTGPLFFSLVASEVGLIPSVEVIAGQNLWARDRAFLERSGAIEPSEEVLLFYSYGTWSIEEDGNMLTDRRVVSYFIDPSTGEWSMASARYEDITAYSVEPGGIFGTTVLTIQKIDGLWFSLFLPGGNNGDVQFINLLSTRALDATQTTPTAIRGIEE